MRSDDKTSILAALRGEPDRLMVLLKLSVLSIVALIAWDIAASSVLPLPIVKAVLALLVLAYGAAMTYLVARALSASRSWESGSVSMTSRLAAPGRRQRLAIHDSDTDGLLGEDVPDELAEAGSRPADVITFNESYFMMQLQEQVKDARRTGGEMCVVAVTITLRGAGMTPDIAQAIAFDMARIASGQARLMSQPLALGDSAFVFSLPHTGLADSRKFIRQIVSALGHYWCYVGIAAFPRDAHDAKGLVDFASAACEESLQSEKRGPVENRAV